MDVILSWVKSGLLFAIFASVILMLSPNKSYMKHISLVVGLLFVLVMIHPIMEFLQLDEKTYLSYIENLLLLEQTEDSISESQLALYEESVGIQLAAVLKENGYPVEQVTVTTGHSGVIENVRITFLGKVQDMDALETYLKNVFGEEVTILYEN